MSPVEYLTAEQMRHLLREVYARDPEKSVLHAIVRRMGNPACADVGERLPRLHPLWLTFIMLIAFMVAVFFTFTFVRI
jgi:hypothetical protein